MKEQNLSQEKKQKQAQYFVIFFENRKNKKICFAMLITTTRFQILSFAENYYDQLACLNSVCKNFECVLSRQA